MLRARDYALILGMPGTGKTTTTAGVVAELVARGKSVLITSYTHTAVDNILFKLMDKGVDFLRLGNLRKVAPQVHAYAEAARAWHTTADVEAALMSASVVATTCLGVNHPLFLKRRFDYCVVDEASQTTVPVCVGPILMADVFVLVGDHHQLPPLVTNEEALAGGLSESLFKILCDAHPEAVASLSAQFRMNADVMAISNALVYDGRLTCANEAVATRRLDLPGRLPSATPGGSAAPAVSAWLDAALDPDRSVIFLNTDNLVSAGEKQSGRVVVNTTEVVIVRRVVEALVRGGLAPADIGVSAPYRAQLKLLRVATASHDGLDCLTVDRFQGKDKEAIVVSLVRSNDDGHVGPLLADIRRANVAFTRAKSKLVLVGSASTLSSVDLYADLLRLLRSNGWVHDMGAGALMAGITPAASQASGVV